MGRFIRKTIQQRHVHATFPLLLSCSTPSIHKGTSALLIASFTLRGQIGEDGGRDRWAPCVGARAHDSQHRGGAADPGQQAAEISGTPSDPLEFSALALPLLATCWLSDMHPGKHARPSLQCDEHASRRCC